MFAPRTSKNGCFTIKETIDTTTIINNKTGTKKVMIFSRYEIITIKYNANGKVVSRNNRKRTRKPLARGIY